jgi:hypothetical protein
VSGEGKKGSQMLGRKEGLDGEGKKEGRGENGGKERECYGC